MSVYLMRHGDGPVYKIGRTIGDVRKRKMQLSTGTPEPLVVIREWATPRSVKMEGHLHDLLARFRLWGRTSKEFFRFDDVQVAIDAGDELMTLYGVEGGGSGAATQEPATRDPLVTAQVEATGDAVAMHHRYQQLSAEIRLLTRERDALADSLKRIVGAAPGLKDGDAVLVSWETQRQSRLDQARLKREHPDLVRGYQISAVTRPFRVL